jgi:hypothetical protein
MSNLAKNPLGHPENLSGHAGNLLFSDLKK